MGILSVFSRFFVRERGWSSLLVVVVVVGAIIEIEVWFGVEEGSLGVGSCGVCWKSLLDLEERWWDWKLVKRKLRAIDGEEWLFEVGRILFDAG